MAESSTNLFTRLTRLFRSGPVVKRKLIKPDDKYTSSAFEIFRKNQSRVYSNAMSAYGTYDRMARYSDFSEMEYCLHADTLIAIPGGYKKISDLAQECKDDPNKSFIVYSYDHNEGRIIPALGKQARQTRIDHAYTVTFDNGQKIIGTPNHRLMKRDGTYCKIEDLSPGDAMMPFYRRDLFNGCKEEGVGYRWIYTMDRRSKMNGWTTEHRLLAEMMKGSQLDENEVVHHKNFIKYDNNVDNLQIMTAKDHGRLHSEILNGKKWSEENSVWIEKFKESQSRFMTESNPSERKDITFGRILEISESLSFNLYKLCEALDTDPNVIKRRLRKAGYNNFEIFARAYNPEWKNAGWNNKGENNPRYKKSVTFENICSAFSKGMKKKDLSITLGVSEIVIDNRIKSNGFVSYGDFSASYENLKVSSIEYHGIIPLFDLTVDGYKNFATDTVISHNTPEIGSALDIYAEESAASDENGNVLHIHSDNTKIKQLLDELFYDTLNIDFNLTSWVRNLCKYGDHFLFNDVSPEYGIINAYPMPISEVEREEGFDPNDPLAVRFRWVTQGNQVLENWQVSHMRLLGNDAFIPYGSSVLEPARRIWRQLILLEDAMLVYRIVRAPERRVFKIDVGNVPPEDIPAYMERAQSSLKRAPISDHSSGRVDLRYNPLSVDEDYFIPVRGSDSGTAIETLGGGTMAGETNDVEYIQKKLFAALKIPKAYLGYDEGLGAKATLSQEDIRFSRTIARVQRTILAELNKIAIIHLHCHGFTDQDLLDFTLRLSNPSTIAQQQKLELFKSRFEAAGTALQTPGLVDKSWVQKNIIRLTEDEINKIRMGQKRDKIHELEIEAVQITRVEGPEDLDLDIGGAAGPKVSKSINLSGPESLSENDSIEDENVPIKIQSSLDRFTSMLAEDSEQEGPLTDDEKREKLRHEYEEKRRKRRRMQYAEMDGNHHSISPRDAGDKKQNSVSGMEREMSDLKSLSSLKLEDIDISEYLDNKIIQNAHMTDRIKSTLSSLNKKLNIKPKKFTGVISENNSSEGENDS